MVNMGDQQYMGLRFCSSSGLPVISRPVRFFHHTEHDTGLCRLYSIWVPKLYPLKNYRGMVVLTNSMPSSVIRGAMFVPIDKQYYLGIVYNLATLCTVICVAIQL